MPARPNDPLTLDRLRSLSLEIEQQIAAAEVRDAGMASREFMTDALTELKSRLVEATRRFENADDLGEKALLGADVRELERLVEIATDQDPDSPRNLSRQL